MKGSDSFTRKLFTVAVAVHFMHCIPSMGYNVGNSKKDSYTHTSKLMNMSSLYTGIDLNYKKDGKMTEFSLAHRTCSTGRQQALSNAQ